MSLGQCCVSGFKVRTESSRADTVVPFLPPSDLIPIFGPRTHTTSPVPGTHTWRDDDLQHDGTPSGKVEDLNGVKTCESRCKSLSVRERTRFLIPPPPPKSDISLPNGDFDKSKALLFLTE